MAIRALCIFRSSNRIFELRSKSAARAVQGQIFKISARGQISEAEKEYSSCVESQVREQCKDQYSKFQSAKQVLEAAISEYESWRQNDCVQQPGTAVGRMRPLGLWPVAQPPQE
jgi:uncharacterized protein YhaN